MTSKCRGRLYRSKLLTLILPLLSQLTVTTEKLLRKKNGTERGLKNQQKNDNIKFWKKPLTKWKTNLKSIKSSNVNSYYSKNWKVITIYLIIIVTVIIEIIVKMIAMLMNRYNSKNQYFQVKNQILKMVKSQLSIPKWPSRRYW